MNLKNRILAMVTMVVLGGCASNNQSYEWLDEAVTRDAVDAQTEQAPNDIDDVIAIDSSGRPVYRTMLATLSADKRDVILIADVTPVSQKDEGGSPDQPAEGVNDAENERRLVGSGTVLRDVTLSLGYSSGYQHSLDRGNENDKAARWDFVYGEAMFHVADLGHEVRLELGPTLRGSAGWYHQSHPDRYGSRLYQAGGGIKMNLRDLSDGVDDPAIWEASLELYGLYTKEQGRVGHDNPFPYRNTTETFTLGAAFRGALLWPMYPLGTELFLCRVRSDGLDPIITGFLPKVELRAEYQNSVHVSKRSTSTSLGIPDRQRNVWYMVEPRIHLWRFANQTPDVREAWLHEVDAVAIGHFDGARRYGWREVRNSHYSNHWGGGLGLHWNITGEDATGWVQLEGQVFRGDRGTDEVMGQVTLNLGISW